MAPIEFLHILLPNDIIWFIREIIYMRKKLEILERARFALRRSPDIFSSYQVVDIVNKVILRCSEISHLPHYLEFKQMVSDWVEYDTWDYRAQTYDAPDEEDYIREFAPHYKKLLKFSDPYLPPFWLRARLGVPFV